MILRPTITQKVVRAARKRGVVVLTRRQWGSKNLSNYQWRRKNMPHHLLPGKPVDTMWQHITVTLDHGPLTGDFKVDVQTVERIGFERFGSGVSYNWLVDMETGMVALGQSLDAKGTHTVMDKPHPDFTFNQNYVSLAIACLGMTEQPLTAKAEAAIVQLIAAHIDAGALTPGHDYLPHSFAAQKDCPCDSTRNRMDFIRAAVKKTAA